MEGLIEFLARLFFEIFIRIIAYFTGYIFLKVITLGKCPAKGRDRDDEWVQFVGVATWLFLFIYFVALKE